MKKTKLTILTAFVFAMLFAPASYGQKQADYGLHFKNQTIEPQENMEAYLKSYSPASEEIFENRFYKIIQFEAIPTHEQRENLEDAGLKLLDYIPHFGYFASLDKDFDIDAIVAAKLRSIIEISPAIKLAPMLFEESYPDYALRGDGKIELLVSVFADVNLDAAMTYLRAADFEITNYQPDGQFYYVISELEDISLLASYPFVNYIEPIYPNPEPENYTGRTMHRSNSIANDFEAGRNYDGTGVSVMLQDDGKIGPHIDFEGRLIEQFINYFGGDHGDHCAGIIGSAGNLDPKARGNAFGADLYVYSAAPDYQGFSAIPSHYFSKQIRVTSTSYSNGCNAGYTSLARSLDMQIINYPALMHVFSAGNDGNSDCDYGAGPGWGNITGGHKVGKNVMTVANLDELDNLSSSSSRGPAHDGRIKPDIAAKGSNVYSTLPDNTYGNKSGTSMSCPGVAGVMAQLFHAYRELNGGSDPLGGLLKGIVLNTAEDLGNPGPDFKFGWGRINALRAVQVLEEGRYDSASIDNQQSLMHQITVPENTGQVRVMIYWTDHQGSVNTNWALVNNLDITLTDPNGTDWLPWVLNHYPDADSLDLPAFRGMDERNNMEQVTLENPEAGIYTLNVEGTVVPEGPQKYYVVYEFIPKALVLTYPFGGERLSPGDEELIRWDAYTTDLTFTLEYSLDNGETWHLISDNVNSERRYFDWDVPTGMTSQAKVRISDGSYTSQNETPFTIMPKPYNLQIDWACDNALHLSWTEMFGASSFTIYRLGEKYMEAIATTSLNSFIVSDISSSETAWFAVSAVGSNGEESQRTMAIKKNPGTFNCNLADAMMISAPSVDWGVFQSSMNIQDLVVTVKVKNFGLEPIVDPSFAYQLGEGNVVNEAYSGTLLPDSTLLFSFEQTIGISDIGTYNLAAWVDYAPDQNPDNDMINVALELIEGSLIAPGNVQTVENFTNCIPAPICELNNCDLADGWINLTNNENDNIDWLTWHGSTNTFNTGPGSDHTTGTSDGKYLYIEPSVICFNKKAILSAPAIDLTEAVSPVLDFWYHAYGADIGRLHVDAFDGSSIHFDIMEPVVGDQGNEWKNQIVDLSQFNGKIIGLRFRGYTGSKDKGDLALDDISITEATGVSENLTIGTLRVYPNPSEGLLSISIDRNQASTGTLKVMDMYGGIVFTKDIRPTSETIIESIDMSNLPKGIYLINYSSEQGNLNSKLTLQ